MSWCHSVTDVVIEEDVEEDTDNVKSEGKDDEGNAEQQQASESEEEEEDDGDDLTGAGDVTLIPPQPLTMTDAQVKVKWHSGFQNKYAVMDDIGKGRFR